MHFVCLSWANISLLWGKISFFANQIRVTGYPFGSVTQKRLLTLQQKPSSLNERILWAKYHLTSSPKQTVCIYFINAYTIWSVSDIRNFTLDLWRILYFFCHPYSICSVYLLGNEYLSCSKSIKIGKGVIFWDSLQNYCQSKWQRWCH